MQGPGHDLSLALVRDSGLLVVAPLLVCNLPGTFVALWKYAIVLRLDRQETGAVLCVVCPSLLQWLQPQRNTNFLFGVNPPGEVER